MPLRVEMQDSTKETTNIIPFNSSTSTEGSVSDKATTLDPPRRAKWRENITASPALEVFEVYAHQITQIPSDPKKGEQLPPGVLRGRQAAKEFARQVINRDRRQTPTSRALFSAFLDNLNWEKGKDWHGLGAYAKVCGVGPKTIEKAKTRLEDTGYIKRKVCKNSSGGWGNGHTTLPALVRAAFDPTFGELASTSAFEPAAYPPLGGEVPADGRGGTRECAGSYPHDGGEGSPPRGGTNLSSCSTSQVTSTRTFPESVPLNPPQAGEEGSTSFFGSEVRGGAGAAAAPSNARAVQVAQGKQSQRPSKRDPIVDGDDGRCHFNTRKEKVAIVARVIAISGRDAERALEAARSEFWKTEPEHVLDALYHANDRFNAPLELGRKPADVKQIVQWSGAHAATSAAYSLYGSPEQQAGGPAGYLFHRTETFKTPFVVLTQQFLDDLKRAYPHAVRENSENDVLREFAHIANRNTDSYGAGLQQSVECELREAVAKIDAEEKAKATEAAARAAEKRQRWREEEELRKTEAAEKKRLEEERAKALLEHGFEPSNEQLARFHELVAEWCRNSGISVPEEAALDHTCKVFIADRLRAPSGEAANLAFDAALKTCNLSRVPGAASFLSFAYHFRDLVQSNVTDDTSSKT